jgi:uncharacterized protein (TIGR02996 family)
MTNPELLRAILDHPEDDDRRVVYADWLEENGQPERAEFIRVQCELAKAPKCRDGRQSCRCRACELDRRSTRLKTMRDANKVANEDKWWWRELRAADSVLIRRGFVEVVHGVSLGAWLENGPAIVSAHPVERVVIIGKEPGRGSGWVNADAPRLAGSSFRRPSPFTPDQTERMSLPQGIFRRLPAMESYANWGTYPRHGFDGDAMTALSVACIVDAKAEAIRQGIYPCCEPQEVTT